MIRHYSAQTYTGYLTKCIRSLNVLETLFASHRIFGNCFANIADECRIFKIEIKLEYVKENLSTKVNVLNIL